MTDLVPLTSRHAVAPTRPAPAPAMTLSETERVCNMIASGGELVPPAYRGKPGAVLLAKLWGDANGVDLFTALQNISPIEGRPYVSAEMRVSMAVAKGFEFRTLEATREVCTLEVWRGSEKLGTITAKITDQPRKLKTAKGYDTPWATHPDDMLFAEACRKADRRHVRTAAALLDAGQDYDATADPLLVLAQQAPDLEPETANPDAALAVDLIDGVLSVGSAMMDILDPPPADADGVPVASTADELVALATAAGLKPPKVGLLKTAQRLGHGVATIDDLAANPAAVEAVKADLADIIARKAAAQQSEG